MSRMIAQVAATASRLRSADPAVRIDGARALVGLVRSFGLEAMPAVLASVDAAAIEFPGEGQQPAAGELRPYALYEPLHEAWRAAAAGDAAVAHGWYAALLDRLEAVDEQTGWRVLHVLSQDPRASPRGGGSPYGPLLAGRAERVLGLLVRWAGAGRRDPRMSQLLLVIRQQATRQDPIRAELAQLAPVLVPVGCINTGFWIELVLERHPDPFEGLAALVAAVPSGWPLGVDLTLSLVAAGLTGLYPGELRRLLTTGKGTDLPALAARLRPHAERWTDAQLDTFVREVLFGVHTNHDVTLEVVLRRAPATRAVPQMLLGLGRSTAGLAELSATLSAALTPREPAATTSARADADAVTFVDDNFKLVVINQLMYVQSVLTPRFDRQAFLNSFDEYELEDEEGDIEDGYVEEIVAHFRALPLTPQHLAQVEELEVNAVSPIYPQIDEYWGGDGDWFNPATYADVALLPNLRKITLCCMHDEETDLSALAALRERGIDVEIVG